MIIQKYADFGFVFGPPSGGQYEQYKDLAVNSNKTIAELHFSFMEDFFVKAQESNLFSRLLSPILGEELSVGKAFQSYKLQNAKDPRVKKFNPSPDDQFVKLPMIMFFPPLFRTPNGNEIKTIVNRVHLDGFGSIISESLNLDWFQGSTTLAE